MRNQETDSQHAKEAGDGACDPTMCLPGGRLERRGSAENRLALPRSAATGAGDDACVRGNRCFCFGVRGEGRGEGRRTGGARQAADPRASPPGTVRNAKEPRTPTRAALQPAANGGGSGGDLVAGGGRCPRPGVDGISFTVRPWWPF